jgi:hypothetical protein
MMSKAEKGKAAKAVAARKVETNDSGQERFVFGIWDTILLKFLTELQESKVAADRNNSHFALILPDRLRRNKALIDLVINNTHTAERIVNSLPCGHKLFYDFIREVKFTK